jgi:beta-N-acetylhexosaminidase
MFGDAVLVSHAIVRQWDGDRPVTLSAAEAAVCESATGYALITKTICRCRVAEGPGHQGGQPAIAEREHGYALHRRQPVRSGQEMAALAECIKQGLRDKTTHRFGNQSSRRGSKAKALLVA